MARGAKECGQDRAIPAAAQGAVEIELPRGTRRRQRATALKRQLTEKVKAEPAAASRLVQSWIREDHDK